ncbi:hypothetical protein [Streptomyces lydicus]|uniref:hypothetical protein n=1 Tax=Streptomyces lydicus TaxID=47763 RepID=UPI00101035C6|nr:hypothetical protein [Streptomyces lydicus]MCZ1012347.1 hypothetical protein [Streptomyces lydicus]
MLLSPPAQTIHPRYEVRTRKRRDNTPHDKVIWDDSRGAYVYRDGVLYTLPLDTPDTIVDAAVAELERTRRSATVIYLACRRTKKGHVLWEPASICGDVIEQTHRTRVVLDLGNNQHTIPASRHVRTIWGSTVKHFYTGSREAEDGAITEDRIDVQGWTEPRHQELFHAVHFGSAAPWFAHFALRYGLAGKHWQFDDYEDKDMEVRPLNANGSAHWLLKDWDREHPAAAGRHYGTPESGHQSN